MSKIFSVAKMVFRKRSLSPTYYWMILAPIILFVVGIGFTKYMQHQTKANKPVIAVVANDSVRKALISRDSKEYKINSKVKTNNSKMLNMYLEDGVLDGVLYINNDFSKVTYKYNASTQASNPINSLKTDLATLRSEYVAAQSGLTKREWFNIIKAPSVRKKVINKESTMEINNSQTAQNFSEAVVIIAFFFLTSYISITGVELGNEKGNHLIEGILAAVSAHKHFAGKMLGISFLILLQTFIYTIIGSITFCILKQTKQIKNFDVSRYLRNIDSEYILIVVILTIISLALYIFLAACFASFVSRAEDISQATTSVASIMLIPYFLSFLTQNNPNMAISQFLSYMPFMSQGIMPVRLAQGAASYTDGYIAIGISLVFALIMYFIASRIYVKNAFSYSAKSPFKALLSTLVIRK